MNEYMLQRQEVTCDLGYDSCSTGVSFTTFTCSLLVMLVALAFAALTRVTATTVYSKRDAEPQDQEMKGGEEIDRGEDLL